MLIWTWQAPECLDALRGGRTWRCDESLATWGEDFAPAYDWLAGEMAPRVGPAPDGVRWPVWGWARYGWVDGARPDDDAMIDTGREHDYARMLLDVPDGLATLVDMDAWTRITMDMPVPPPWWSLMADAPRCLAALDAWDASLPRDPIPDGGGRRESDGSWACSQGNATDAVRRTWQWAFDAGRHRDAGGGQWSGKDVQAVLWELRPEWLVDGEAIHNEPHEPSWMLGDGDGEGDAG